jgi:hypothetical protein
MVMKQYNAILILLLTGLIIISLLMVACMAEEYSVFWSIHLTEKEIDSSLDNELTIESMTNDGDYYYIATGGSMWKKSVTAPTEEAWEKVSLPQKGAICTGMTLFSGDLYAGFIFNNGTTGLYKTATDPINWGIVNNSDMQIQKLMVVNGELFISLMYSSGDSYKFGLYYLNGTDYQPTSIIDKYLPVKNIILVGTTYWVISGNKVFSGTDPGSLEEVTTDPLYDESDNKYEGIHYSAGSIYYLSANNGKIYRSSDTINWDSSDVKKVTNKTVKFTEFAEVNGNILVGTTAFGFYQMPGGTLESLERIDLLSSELDRSHVMRFHVDGDKVFFCTATDGLYSNSYNGEWLGSWIHE